MRSGRGSLELEEMKQMASNANQGTVSVIHTDNSTLLVKLSGPWHLTRDVPSAASLRREIESTPMLKTVSFDTSGLADWGSGLISFLVQTSAACRAHNIDQVRGGMPEGMRRLLELAEAVPEKKGTRGVEIRAPFFQRVGNLTIGYGLSVGDFMAFLGDLTVTFSKFLRGKARYRRVDLVEVIQECGANAVGIVTLISFLVGVILAFMGAVQLSQFGASIYVADLVCIGMTRDMGAIMTAIIMSGRTGAAFAAKLGTMKVTQEIDALTTMGISPMEFLVLPRVIALVLMMPLLCLYADFLGIVGGLFVGVGMLGLSARNYMQETISTLTLTNLFGGLFKATFYGFLIALAGCLRGFQCGNSSSAVGDAATQAVVMSIVMGVVACGIFAVVFNVIGI
jgi:phospholipid/cholesterol/gamma-HCH transport system permease protein